MNDLQADLVIPASVVTDSGVVIYAPTHLSAGDPCLETVMVHDRYPATDTRHYHGFWDWCTPQGNPNPLSNGTNWAYNGVIWIDAVFRSRHVRTYDGEDRYFTQVYHFDDPLYGNCWEGLLFNFNTGLWDQYTMSCGETRLNFSFPQYGWTMWESWYLMSQGCPALPSINASHMFTADRSGTNWYGYTLTDPKDGFATCWQQGVYKFYRDPLSTNSWRTETPNP